MNTSAAVVFDPLVLADLELAQRALEATEARLLTTFLGRAEVRAAANGVPLDQARREVFEEDRSTLAELAAECDVTRDRLADVTRVYRFRSLGFKAWRALRAAHPSRDPGLAFDEESIAPTLLREASLEPRLSAAMVEEILTSPDWSEGEVRLLLSAAVRAQS